MGRRQRVLIGLCSLTVTSLSSSFVVSPLFGAPSAKQRHLSSAPLQFGIFGDQNNRVAASEAEVESLKQQLESQKREYERSMQELFIAHSEERSRLEQKIEELTKQLEKYPKNDEFDKKAAQIELQLRSEIDALTAKLDEADAARLKDKELQEIMAKEQKALEDEIAKLRKEYELGTDWKYMFEEEKEARLKAEKESREEIERLQKEIRVVFSIGRRTSDKLVEDLSSKLEQKEETLRMSMEEVGTKDRYISELVGERSSLRKLLLLSLKLTGQRLRARLKTLRKKILGRPLPARRELSEAERQQEIRIRKSRGRNSI